MERALILAVGEQPSVLRSELDSDRYRAEVVTSVGEGANRLSMAPVPDLLFLSSCLQDMATLEALHRFRELHPQLKIVIVGSRADTREANKAGRLGAIDYITCEITECELRRAMEQWLLLPLEVPQSDDPTLPEVVEVAGGISLVCASPLMQQVYSEAASFANYDIPVLLLGESGTGKEIISLLIHNLSSRADQPFLKVNCAALPSSLLESELFGYEAGAFSGATKSKPGKFELCDKGTILLDEVGEMTRELQAKLLHVLQDGQFSRLGGQTIQKVDVRVLAATNIDIDRAIASKQMREDLYYRLNGFTLQIPPLRERKTEIPALLHHFMTRIANQYGRPPLPFSQRLIHACLSYSWPGNVRQLENFVKRYLILADESLALSFFHAPGASSERAIGVPDKSELKHLARAVKKEAEAGAILNALNQTSWHRGKAAVLLNISYKALLYKIQEYGLKPPGNL